MIAALVAFATAFTSGQLDARASNVGNVCVANVNGVRYYSVMGHSQPTGSKCFVYNQRFQPLFEGHVVSNRKQV